MAPLPKPAEDGATNGSFCGTPPVVALPAGYPVQENDHG